MRPKLKWPLPKPPNIMPQFMKNFMVVPPACLTSIDVFISLIIRLLNMDLFSTPKGFQILPWRFVIIS